MELKSVAPSPGCTARPTNGVVELVALSKATALAASRCQPTHLPVLVDWFGNPLGVGISSDSFMEWINEDNLEEFVRRIFTNPVGIQDPQGHTVAASALLRNRLQASSELELVDTMVHRLAVGGTFRNWAFAAPAAHTDPVYDIACLSGGQGGREGGGLGTGLPRRHLRRAPRPAGPSPCLAL